MMFGINSRSKGCDCENCIHADIAKEPRTIVKGNMTIHQGAGSISCTLKSIHTLVITDEGMCCSQYEERKT